MANSSVPGPLCGSNAPALDDGTLALWRMPSPGPVCAIPPPPVVRQWHHFSRACGFPASALTMSPEAVRLLQGIEKLWLTPYDDQTSKATTVWVKGATIGYGHLIAKSDWDTYKDGITEEAANALFIADAEPFEHAVGEAITVGVQQYEFDAMVILAFNIGKGGFRHSTVVRLINTVPVDLTALEHSWKSWNKSQGKVSTGLNNRRAAEWRIYTSAIYERW